MATAAEMAPAAGVPFEVRTERPRIWIRADRWNGPSVPDLKTWFERPDYRQRGVAGHKDLQYVVQGDEAAGAAAVAHLGKMRIGGGSPSYTGAQAQRMAARYDWLRRHPAFTDEVREAVVARLEKWGDFYLRYVTRAGAPIYYSRYPGAIGGLTVIGLALHGDSPKADAYIAGAYKALVEYGKARQYEDGASAGGTYSIHHAFPDLARAVAAFESATDAKLLDFIREKQGNWLERQLLWQIWSTRPNGYFVKEGDLWQQPDSRQTRMQVDVVTRLLRHGHGRAHADWMHERWGRRDYHRAYVWNFFVFNHPEVKRIPLRALGRAELFGRDCHGYVFFRSGWGMGDTYVFFRCGEGLDVHSNRGAGGFDLFRHRTLAERANRDYPKSDDHIRYSNVIVFNGHNHRTSEMKTDVPLDFDAFLRRKKRRNVEWASIVEHEVTDAFARVKGDLSAAVRQDCKTWTRELVFLGYKYLVVLDRVETLKPGTQQQWQLHFCAKPKRDGPLAYATVGDGRLFCRTLLPADATFAVEPVRKYHRYTVSPKTATQTMTYLHVLYPTDAAVGAMPATGYRQEDRKLTVTVDDLSYTFPAP
jgi:hypothetical protein